MCQALFQGLGIEREKEKKTNGEWQQACKQFKKPFSSSGKWHAEDKIEHS
jgi:hypothetical protein